MFRGYQRYVSLVLCLSCILSGLFLNTYVVKAAYQPGAISVSNSVSFTLSPSDIEYIANGGTLTIEKVTGTSSAQGISISETGNYNGNEGGTGNISSSTGSVAYTGTETGRTSSSGSGTASQQLFSTGSITGTISNSSNGVKTAYELDFEVPINPYSELLKGSNFDSNYPYVLVTGYGLSCSSSLGNVTGCTISYNGKDFGNRQYVLKDSILKGSYYTPTFTFKGHLSYVGDSLEAKTFTVTCNYTYFTRDASSSEASATGQIVNDISGNQKLDDLNNSTDAIEDSTTNPNGNGILGTIKSFFGSFFTNIRNSLIAVFVPEDGYFSNWFNRLNTLLADKLGVLYYPFDLIISFLTDLQSESSQSGQIVFPEVALPMNGEQHVIIERTVLNLGNYDVSFNSSDNSSLVGTTGYTSIVSTIRTFSSFAICLALVFLFIKKLNHIINGEAS